MISNNQSNRLSQLSGIVLKSPIQTKTFVNYHRLYLIRLLSENMFIFLLQYIGASLTLIGSSYIWMAAGTACGFLFLRGVRIIFAIFLGTLAAHYVAGIAMTTATLCSFLHALQAFALLYFSHIYISPTLIYYDLRFLFRFIIASFLITAAITCLLTIVNQNFTEFYSQWLANLNGTLIFSFAIVTLDMYFPDKNTLNNKDINHILLLLFTLVILMLVLFACINSDLAFFMMFAIMGLHAIIAFAFGWCGAVISLFLTSILIAFASNLELLIIDNFLQYLYLEIMLLASFTFGLSIAILRRIPLKSCIEA